MNMQLVTGKMCFVNCIQCAQQTAIGDGADQFRNSPGLADLDGEPFKAYYCTRCAPQHDMCECGHERHEHESRGVINPCNHKSSEVQSPEDLGALHRYGYTRHCTCYNFRLRRIECSSTK